MNNLAVTGTVAATAVAVAVPVLEAPFRDSAVQMYFRSGPRRIIIEVHVFRKTRKAIDIAVREDPGLASAGGIVACRGALRGTGTCHG
jgi:hypothetical protein